MSTFQTSSITERHIMDPYHNHNSSHKSSQIQRTSLSSFQNNESQRSSAPFPPQDRIQPVTAHSSSPPWPNPALVQPQLGPSILSFLLPSQEICTSICTRKQKPTPSIPVSSAAARLAFQNRTVTHVCTYDAGRYPRLETWDLSPQAPADGGERVGEGGQERIDGMGFSLSLVLEGYNGKTSIRLGLGLTDCSDAPRTCLRFRLSSSSNTNRDCLRWTFCLHELRGERFEPPRVLKH